MQIMPQSRDLIRRHG